MLHFCITQSKRIRQGKRRGHGTYKDRYGCTICYISASHRAREYARRKDTVLTRIAMAVLQPISVRQQKTARLTQESNISRSRQTMVSEHAIQTCIYTHWIPQDTPKRTEHTHIPIHAHIYTQCIHVRIYWQADIQARKHHQDAHALAHIVRSYTVNIYTSPCKQSIPYFDHFRYLKRAPLSLPAG